MSARTAFEAARRFVVANRRRVATALVIARAVSDGAHIPDEFLGEFRVLDQAAENAARQALAERSAA